VGGGGVKVFFSPHPFVREGRKRCGMVLFGKKKKREKRGSRRVGRKVSRRRFYRIKLEEGAEGSENKEKGEEKTNSEAFSHGRGQVY